METNESNNQEIGMENQVPMAEEPKKKSKKGFIIGGIAVIVIILIGIGVYAATRKSPLTMLNEGFDKTMNSVRPGIGEYLGSEELVKFVEAGVYEQSFQFTIDDIVDEFSDFSMLIGSEIGTAGAYDNANKKMDSNLYISYGGQKIIDANIFGNNNTVSISAPDYFEGFIEAETTNFGIDFNKSALSTLLGVQLNGNESFVLFPEKKIEESTEETTTEETTESFDLLNSLGKIKSGIDEELLVEKTKNKEDIEVGGVVESCSEYSMFFPKAYIVATRDVMVEYMKTMSVTQPEEMKVLMDTFSKIEFNDATVYLYLDKEGRVVKMKFDTDYILDGETLNAVFNITATGKEYLWDDFDCTISYLFSGELGKLDIGWKKSTAVEGTAVKTNHKINLSDGEFTVATNVDITFNQESGELLVKGETAPNDGEIGNLIFNFTGKFSEVNKGSGFALDISDLSISAGGEAYGMSLSGAYRLAPLSREVKVPEGTQRTILMMSEDELKGFAMEVMMNFQTSPIGKLMESLY